MTRVMSRTGVAVAVVAYAFGAGCGGRATSTEGAAGSGTVPGGASGTGQGGSDPGGGAGVTNGAGGAGATTGGTTQDAGSGGATFSGGTSGGGTSGAAPVGGAGASAQGGAAGGAAGGGTGGALALDGGADSGAVLPDTCATDNDCTPYGALCEPTLKACVRCYDEVHCPQGFTCEGNGCVPYVDCSSSLDCASAPDGKTICDTTAGRCVECNYDAECGNPGYCIDHRCECADLLNDPNNCGACGRVCSSGCTNGDCAGEFRTECSDAPADNCDEWCELQGLRCRAACGDDLNKALAVCDETTVAVSGMCSDPFILHMRCCCAPFAQGEGGQ